MEKREKTMQTPYTHRTVHSQFEMAFKLRYVKIFSELYNNEGNHESIDPVVISFIPSLRTDVLKEMRIFFSFHLHLFRIL